MTLPSTKDNKIARASWRFQIIFVAVALVEIGNASGSDPTPSRSSHSSNDNKIADYHQKSTSEYIFAKENKTDPLSLKRGFSSESEILGQKTSVIRDEGPFFKKLNSIERHTFASSFIKIQALQMRNAKPEKQIQTGQTKSPLFFNQLPSPIENWEKYAVYVEPDGRPMLAIVFDDLGVDKARTQAAIKLPAPLTMSFLPYAEALGEQADAARLAGHEIWMHVPMEPNKANIDPGPKVLLTGSAPAELLNNLAWSLDRFDRYVGINNHMGSRFTANLAEMHVVMQELNRRGLAFLDSLTSSQSQGRLAALTTGVAFAARNIFLDHQDDVAKIKEQLSKLETLAIRQGHAIAIAHPRDRTLETVKIWLESLDNKGLLLVPVSALLNRSNTVVKN